MSLDKKQCIYRVQILRLEIDLLESLTRRFIEGAAEFATPEKWGEYVDRFQPELEKLRDDVQERRQQLLESGMPVPNDWLTFPVEIAYQIDTESDGPVVAPNPEIQERWKDVYQALGIQIDRLQYEPSRDVDSRDPLPPVSTSTNDTEEQMVRIAEAVGDENSGKIVALANRTDLSGEKKMLEILKIDKRFASKTAIQWSELLSITDAAIRGYDTWKLLRGADKAAE